MHQSRNACISQLILLLALLLLMSTTTWVAPAPIAQAQSTFDCTNVTEIPESECEALVALYNATDGDNWANSTSWLTTNTPCDWHGVSCDANHVGQLRLSSNQLNGSIPPEIGDLIALTELFLANNQLNGPIPPKIGNLTSLDYLLLFNNQLTGSIPRDIGNLTTLHTLWLLNNKLSGSVPAEIGNLTTLGQLDLSHNQLSTLPPEIGNLHRLDDLFLHDNPLNGEVPAALTSLTIDDFSFYDTNLCVPLSSEMSTWLNSIPNVYGTGIICEEDLGSLGGTVTLTDTTLLSDIQVTIYRSLPNSNWREIATTQTDALGTYQFENLGQGNSIDYRVRFTDPTDQLAPQYYDGKPAIEGATPIIITPGMPRTNINAVMALPKTRVVVFESFLRSTCGCCVAAAPDIDRLMEEYSNRPVVFLEYDADDGAFWPREERGWVAQGRPEIFYLPMTVVDSGYRYSSGYYENFYTSNKEMIDAALNNPPHGEVTAYMRRTSDAMIFDVSVTNQSGQPLNNDNSATVFAMVYEEDSDDGLTKRFVLASGYTNFSTPLDDGDTRHVNVTTDGLGDVNWDNVHGVTLVDYRPAGDTSPYQVLQAAPANWLSVEPPVVTFFIDTDQSTVTPKSMSLNAPQYLTWRLSYQADWLDITDTSGTGQDVPTIAVDPAQLASGWQGTDVTLQLLDTGNVIWNDTVTVEAYLGDVSRIYLPLVARY